MFLLNNDSIFLQDQFKASYENILKERENEARLLRVREAREKAEKVGYLLILVISDWFELIWFERKLKLHQRKDASSNPCKEWSDLSVRIDDFVEYSYAENFEIIVK